MALQLVSTVTVGSGGAASIEFTGIAGTGKDLLLLTSLRNTRSEIQDNFYLRLNNNTGTNYNKRRLTGYNSAVQTSSETASDLFQVEVMIPGTLATSNTFGNHSVYITNYAGSANKSLSFDGVSENNATTAAPGIAAGSWSQTSAITSIQLLQFGGNFAEHSTASLYIVS
jgi:hypothetical protein